MSFIYKSMGAKHSNWKLSQNNQYVSYALLSLGGSILVWVLLFEEGTEVQYYRTQLLCTTSTRAVVETMFIDTYVDTEHMLT